MIALNLEKNYGILCAASLYRSQSNSRTANSDICRCVSKLCAKGCFGKWYCFAPTKHKTIFQQSHLAIVKMVGKVSPVDCLHILKVTFLLKIVLLCTEPHIRAPVVRRFCNTVLWIVQNEDFWGFGGVVSCVRHLHSLEWNPPVATISRRRLSRERLLFTLFRVQSFRRRKVRD